MSCDKEYITCAAIHYLELSSPTFQPKNISSGMVLCGHRHPNIVDYLFTLTKMRSIERSTDPLEVVAGEMIQGFMTSKNRFVTREEAAKIAVKARQVKEDDLRGGELYSEDIY